MRTVPSLGPAWVWLDNYDDDADAAADNDYNDNDNADNGDLFQDDDVFLHFFADGHRRWKISRSVPTSSL